MSRSRNTTTHTTTDAQSRPRSVASVLLTRRGAVYLPASGGRADPAGEAGAAVIEAELVQRGYLVSPGLRRAFAASGTGVLGDTGRALLDAVDYDLGAHRDHVPLLRGFPDTVPEDTYRHYVERVLSALFQHPDQPCVLCGTAGSVVPVAPCAHLVCGACFDGADFSACPVCERRIDPADPFLRPAPPRRRVFGRAAGAPQRLRLLSHGGDLTACQEDAARELDALLARTGALSPQDADDLGALLAARSRDGLDRLPPRVPGRETKARLVSWLLDAVPADPADPAHRCVAEAAARIDTATDVLRVLVLRSGGDPGLVDIPRFAPTPRPLRRVLLSVLDTMDPAQAVEDMRRHRRAWIHAAERLHPFEQADRFPRAALAFAALRGTPLTDDALSAVLRRTAAAHGIDATGGSVTAHRWSGRVEAALADRDVDGALALLGSRPGELVRRLDHVLRLAVDRDRSAADRSDRDRPGADRSDLDRSAAGRGEAEAGTHRVQAVVRALEHAVTSVAPAVLLSALGSLRVRDRQHTVRVFFPKAGAAKTHVTDDVRPPLPAAVTHAVTEVLTGEVLRRAGRGAPVGVAVVDADLDGMIAPFAERTASRALVTLPRGSEIALPGGRSLRLFLTWTESEASGRTDLDLSVAMFDAHWRHIGVCDYTHLRYARQAAVHSGDLQSAPPPLGATEFVDLDLDLLAAAGARYAVAVVFSYNDVPFGELAEAFAGLMLRDGPGGAGPLFDPRSVEQRFDLTGSSRACVPLVVDLQSRTLRWLDVVKGVTGTQHAVWRHADALATLAHRLTELFASGARVGLGELARWHAAARAGTVVLRHRDGSRVVYTRRDDEDVSGFAARIGTPDADSGEIAEAPSLVYLLRGDIQPADGAEAYALHPLALDAARVRLLAAPDLVTTLAPA
ncbi:RING finger family 4 domain-containing protein [Streptomyces zhihengii]|uniref:RING finger family 4 domain-containing protein n=1 Tax=Streptomyces zhihengii TaxID=1818004 RepID=UPI003640577A